MGIKYLKSPFSLVLALIACEKIGFAGGVEGQDAENATTQNPSKKMKVAQPTPQPQPSENPFNTLPTPQPQHPKNPFNDLPPELIKKILGFSGIKARMAVSSVSKEMRGWYWRFRSQFYVKKPLETTFFSASFRDYAAQNTENIRLQLTYFDGHLNPTAKDLDQFLALFPKVCIQNFYVLERRAVQDRHLPSLSLSTLLGSAKTRWSPINNTLNLWNIKDNPEKSSFLEILKWAPKTLTKLELDSCSLTSDACVELGKLTPPLTSLTLSYIKGLTLEGIKGWNLSNLTRCKINLMDIPPDALEVFLNKLSPTCIDFSFLDQDLNTLEVFAGWPGLSGLQTLALGTTPSDRKISRHTTIVQRATGLTSFSAAGATGIAVKQLLISSSAYPQTLRSLEIANLDEEEAIKLARRLYNKELPFLTHLDIGDSYYLTAKGFDCLLSAVCGLDDFERLSADHLMNPSEMHFPLIPQDAINKLKAEQLKNAKGRLIEFQF